MKRLLPLILLALGCGQRTPPVAVTGQPAGNGWEVRYNAVLALARRGSDKFTDPVAQDLLAEMLDEAQQTRNFRTKLPNGTEVGDAITARATVLGTLLAVTEFKKQRPTIDLSHLKPVVDKLAAHSDQSIARPAAELAIALAPKKT